MKTTPNKIISLSQRLILSLVSTITVITVVVASSFYFYTAAELERNFADNVEETLSYLDGTLGRLLWFYDHDSAARVAETVLRNDFLVVGVTIRDEQKNEVISIAEQRMDAVVVETRSVHYNALSMGEVEVHFSRALLKGELDRILWISFSVWLLTAISIILLTSMFVRKQFHGPLQSFIQLAKSYQQHPESPPQDATAYIEFQPIERVVKELADDVYHQLRELGDHRRHLETEVDARTSDLLLARDEAEKARARAEVANQAKSTFLANMSHELRTPLNAILGFSEMLARDPDVTTGQRERLNTINRSGEHLLSMINDVLDLSKIESGRIELELASFDLPAMLQDIARLFEGRAESAGLRFDLEIDPALSHFIKSDVSKLRQILTNLLGNAVKFTQEGGFSLRARTIPEVSDSSIVSLQLEVKDSGPGIPERELQHIFEPFIQIGHSPSKAKGTGLGLAITKSFVELMGGEIGVQSGLGQGSLFYVKLPVALAEGAEAAGIEGSKPAVLGLAPGEPEWRILVVEDDAENRLLLRSILEQAGFEVQEAENGKEAISQFTQWQPHFIWMDMRMPVMDGYDATIQIRGLPGGDAVKIVALTASAFKEQRHKILEAGCDEVLHKPYQTHQIFDCMGELLGMNYIFEEMGGIVKEPPGKLSREQVSSLPVALQQELYAGVKRLDEHRVLEVVRQVAEIDPDVAATLQRLAENFDWEQLLELLEEDTK
jgi:signal transduction histidine kinase/DNA-binding NarL/FixJ family response regulator